MKTYRQEIPTATLTELADKYDLTMEVKERPAESEDSPSRFYASFQRVDIKQDEFLVSSHGNGKSPEEAVDVYRERIHRQPLVKGAWTDGRVEIPPHNIRRDDEEVERVTKTYHTTERMGHIMSHDNREQALKRARAFPGRIVAYETTQIKRRISAPLEGDDG